MTDSVGVPFVTVGNRRGLTSLQLVESPELAEFVKRFRHCFEFDPSTDIFLFIEQDLPKSEPN